MLNTVHLTGRNVSTNMYLHQQQALTFLLLREQSIDYSSRIKTSDEGSLDVRFGESMWRPRVDIHQQIVGWKNLVTETVRPKKLRPAQCRGSILADDVSTKKAFSMHGGKH